MRGGRRPRTRRSRGARQRRWRRATPSARRGWRTRSSRLAGPARGWWAWLADDGRGLALDGRRRGSTSAARGWRTRFAVGERGSRLAGVVRGSTSAVRGWPARLCRLAIGGSRLAGVVPGSNTRGSRLAGARLAVGKWRLALVATSSADRASAARGWRNRGSQLEIGGSRLAGVVRGLTSAARGWRASSADGDWRLAVGGRRPRMEIGGSQLARRGSRVSFAARDGYRRSRSHPQRPGPTDEKRRKRREKPQGAQGAQGTEERRGRRREVRGVALEGLSAWRPARGRRRRWISLLVSRVASMSRPSMRKRSPSRRQRATLMLAARCRSSSVASGREPGADGVLESTLIRSPSSTVTEASPPRLQRRCQGVLTPGAARAPWPPAPRARPRAPSPPRACPPASCPWRARSRP